MISTYDNYIKYDCVADLRHPYAAAHTLRSKGGGPMELLRVWNAVPASLRLRTYSVSSSQRTFL